MKLFQFVAMVTLTLSGPLAWAQPQPAQTQNLFQRNCSPGDVYISKNTVVETVSCNWQPTSDNDGGMQMTIHDKDNTVQYVTAYCVFMPANEQAPDQIASVEAHKAAWLDRADITAFPDDVHHAQFVKFIFYNERNDRNMNVAVRFYNHWNYTPGDNMTCVLKAY